MMRHFTVVCSKHVHAHQSRALVCEGFQSILTQIKFPWIRIQELKHPQSACASTANADRIFQQKQTLNKLPESSTWIFHQDLSQKRKGRKEKANKL